MHYFLSVFYQTLIYRIFSFISSGTIFPQRYLFYIYIYVCVSIRNQINAEKSQNPLFK